MAKLFKVDLGIVATVRYSTDVTVTADDEADARAKAYKLGGQLYAYDFEHSEPDDFRVAVVEIRDTIQVFKTLFTVSWDTPNGPKQVSTTSSIDALKQLQGIDPACKPRLTVEKGTY